MIAAISEAAFWRSPPEGLLNFIEKAVPKSDPLCSKPKRRVLVWWLPSSAKHLQTTKASSVLPHHINVFSGGLVTALLSIADCKQSPVTLHFEAMIKNSCVLSSLIFVSKALFSFHVGYKSLVLHIVAELSYAFESRYVLYAKSRRKSCLPLSWHLSVLSSSCTNTSFDTTWSMEPSLFLIKSLLVFFQPECSECLPQLALSWALQLLETRVCSLPSPLACSAVFATPGHGYLKTSPCSVLCASHCLFASI